MDLWVRSQDKKRLIKCEELGLQEKLQGQFAVIIGNRHILGTYKNKARAIEVLDEIQKLITPQVLLLADKIKKKKSDKNLTNVFGIVNSDGNIDIKELSTVVYEMPQE